MTPDPKARSKTGFRHFFLRGLAIVLPSVLTLWIVFVTYQFVQVRIAAPINSGVRSLFLAVSPLPVVVEEELIAEQHRLREGIDPQAARRSVDRRWVVQEIRRQKVESFWRSYAFPLDLIGLALAVVMIYLAGAGLGSFIGRRLYLRGEEYFHRLPLIKHVYPSVKQVTEFLVGPADEEGPERINFSRVVAVEYPRKGIWSVGLVTGPTMIRIQERAGRPCVTVFIPSSPTPFTGYVITVPEDDTIDLPISIEQALRFCVSGGVLLPPQQDAAKILARASAAGDKEASLRSPERR